jgi:DNA-binding response OmpR family regulator
MAPLDQNHLRSSLRELAAVFAATVSKYERFIESLESELTRLNATPAIQPIVDSRQPRVDRDLFTVVVGRRRCFLGNTVSFRLIERLLRQPNKYVSVTELEAEVWGGGVRTREAVRSAVKILRRRLREAKMHDLADAVAGRASGYYAILLEGE